MFLWKRVSSHALVNPGWILMMSIAKKLVVKVWSSRSTGSTDATDGVVFIYMLASTHGNLVQMSITGAVAIWMFYLNQLTVTAFARGVSDCATCSRPHFGARWRGKIYSKMGDIAFQYGMKALVCKTGANTTVR